MNDKANTKIKKYNICIKKEILGKKKLPRMRWKVGIQIRKWEAGRGEREGWKACGLCSACKSNTVAQVDG